MRSPLNFFPRNIFLTNRDMLEVKVQPTKITNIMTKKTFTTETETIITEKTTTTTTPEEKNLKDIAPKKVGRLDMVIAFDTTGSMAAYIEDVRQQVADLIPRLFKDNDDLRLGIVAFGDYCDMDSKHKFGKAYQCLPPTNNENDIIKFVRKSENTSGGDGDEFYELVIKKIVEETPWRQGSTRSILLISDAEPHEVGYTYEDYVVCNQIDWRHEARKAAKQRIKIDTVTICPLPWYQELSRMTNGVSVPFSSSHNTSDLIVASTLARGSHKQRVAFDEVCRCCADPEMASVLESYLKEREDE